MQRLVKIKKVCVIGAGLSGLVTIKELKDEHHQVVCYEKEAATGGVFYSRPGKGGAYDSTLLTISNHFMAFSSMPPEQMQRRYWTHQEYRRYLSRFAERFDLLDHVVFDAEVRSVHQRGDGAWVVGVSASGHERQEVFDAVAVCSGKFRLPHVPDLPGLSRFRGEVLHTSSYKNADPLWDKKVVCVGLGETGADVCHEVAQVARSTTLVVRHPPSLVARSMLPFFGRDTTNDAATSRLLSSWVDFGYGDPSARAIKAAMDRKATLALRNTVSDPGMRLFVEWIRMGGDDGLFYTKNDIFLRDVTDGKLKFNLFGIEEVFEDHVVCGDGEKVEADAVVLCTGYRDDFSFLEHDVCRQVESDLRALYKHVFHPRIGASLAFIGFVRPRPGGVPLCAELQARWFAALCSEKLDLPERQDMEHEAQQDRQAERAYYHRQPDVSELVIYHAYADDLAQRIGCRPRISSLLFDPHLLWKYYVGSTVPSTFRLCGPGQNRDQAKKLVKQLEAAYSFPTILVLLARNGIGRLLYRLDKLSQGRLSRRMAAPALPVEPFLVQELQLGAGTLKPGEPVHALCSDDVAWRNLKYKLHLEYRLEPKSLTEDLTVTGLRQLVEKFDRIGA